MRSSYFDFQLLSRRVGWKGWVGMEFFLMIYKFIPKNKLENYFLQNSSPISFSR